MIRIVDLRKALWAGALAAVALEIVSRLLALAGAPLVDIVGTLGTIVAPHASAWIWWPAGMVLHLIVGMLWAVFYAYFFWSLFVWRPLVQGLVFALIPASLSELIM